MATEDSEPAPMASRNSSGGTSGGSRAAYLLSSDVVHVTGVSHSILWVRPPGRAWVGRGAPVQHKHVHASGAIADGATISRSDHGRLALGRFAMIFSNSRMKGRSEAVFRGQSRDPGCPIAWANPPANGWK